MCAYVHKDISVFVAQQAKQRVHSIQLHQQMIQLRDGGDHVHLLDDVIQVQLRLHEPTGRRSGQKLTHSNAPEHLTFSVDSLLRIVREFNPELLVFVRPLLKGQDHFLHHALIHRLPLLQRQRHTAVRHAATFISNIQLNVMMEHLRVHLVLVHQLLQDPLSVLWIVWLGFWDRRRRSGRLPGRYLFYPSLLRAAFLPWPLASSLRLSGTRTG